MNPGRNGPHQQLLVISAPRFGAEIRIFMGDTGPFFRPQAGPRFLMHPPSNFSTSKSFCEVRDILRGAYHSSLLFAKSNDGDEDDLIHICCIKPVPAYQVP